MSRKRKFETEMGTERRNPSRKARPPENFAVEEKSEPVTSRSPRTIDIRRLVEVRFPTLTVLCINPVSFHVFVMHEEKRGKMSFLDTAGYYLEI